MMNFGPFVQPPIIVNWNTCRGKDMKYVFPCGIHRRPIQSSIGWMGDKEILSSISTQIIQDNNSTRRQREVYFATPCNPETHMMNKAQC